MSENYIIIGDDEYIKEKEELKIKEKFLSPDEANLNYSAHTADDIGAVMDSLGTMPFLSSKRVVVIKDIQKCSDETADTLLDYLKKPNKTSILVLSGPADFAKSSCYKKFRDLLKTVKADTPDAATVKSWIRAFFRKENIEISPQAVDLIVELKGTDTAAIKLELDKLICFSGGDRVENAHVEQLVGRSVAENVFKLVDAINSGDADWVFRVVNDLYDQKKEPHEIIGYLGWYIRVMQKVTLLSRKKADVNSIASAIGYSPAYARRLMKQAGDYTVERIRKWLNMLLETDLKIKTGRQKPRLALEILLINLVRH